MKKLLLLLLSLLLVVGCTRPGDAKRESDKIFRLGVNGNTAFKNIISEEPVTIGEEEYYTKYGHGEIIFDIDNTTKERFAIFSIPADEDVETYFRFEIESELKYESNTHFVLCTYTELSPKDFSIYYENGQIKGSAPLLTEATPIKYIVKVAGKFEKYKQENFVVVGVDTSYLDVGADNDSLTRYINSISDENKNLFKENSAYVVAYPWRKIKVLVENDNGKIDSSSTVKDMINYADSIFQQAICNVELTTDTSTSNYDCKIILSNNINKNVVFYDEADEEYSIVLSKEFSYAKVRDNNKRSFTYAIAYLLGVSLFEDEVESSKTINKNLMDTTIIDGYHLSFRQWNQLHIREKK